MAAKLAIRIRLGCWIALAVVAISPQIASAQVRLRHGRTAKPKADFSDRTVTFDTMDGVTIEADWYPVKVEEGKRTPVALLIHMYPATRSSWKPLVPVLRDELGIAVLAYDIRGTGGSTKPADRKLDEGYKNRDTAHFANAWMDAMAAHQWLSQQSNIDTERMIVIGASVGCSISLDFASRVLNLKGVACLSPGTNYMGIDSLTHIQTLKGTETKVLLIAPEGEYAAVEELMKAGEGAKVKGKKYPGGPENHGTKMFEAKYGKKVKTRLSKFASGVLGVEKKAKADKKDDDKEKGDDEDKGGDD